MAVTPASAAMARMVAPAKPWVPKARRADARTPPPGVSSPRALAGPPPPPAPPPPPRPGLPPPAGGGGGRPRRGPGPGGGGEGGGGAPTATASQAPPLTPVHAYTCAWGHRPDRHQRAEDYVAATIKEGRWTT